MALNQRIDATAAAGPRSAESPGLVVVKALVMMAVVFAYLVPLATTSGLVAGLLATAAAYPLASWLEARRLRLGIGLLAAAALTALGLWIGSWVRTSDGLWGFLGVTATIDVADALSFGLALLGVVGGVRLLALRVRSLAFVEAAVVIGAAVWTFAAHQRSAISEPRWFADWVLERGLDPLAILSAVGIGAAVLSLVMLVRRSQAAKVALTFLVVAIAGAIVYFITEDTHIEPPISSNGLGLTQQEQDKGKGDKNKESKSDKDKDKDKDGKGGSGGAPGDDPFDGSGAGGSPSPVAVVILRDDYDDASQGSVLYFRQQVLSRYAEGKLQPATEEAYDRDVIGTFPRDTPVTAEPTQVREHHLEFPTSMHLMVDHPQPVALTHAERLRLIPNPNPRTFVASYEVESLRLTMDYDRLVGRHSASPDWSQDKRDYYTAAPDDPRYAALADIILRDLDPRFYDDDMMKALLIKRFLEKEGVYTLKEKHNDTSDPTASFLFGNLRGYCVHFAHAAAFLMRSQGIATRVALGYAVQTHKRSGGSSMLIMSSDAHAWPEIYVDGVGWVTFDVYPERSDEPYRQLIDRNLESMLGEMARDDKTGGKNPDADDALVIPWGTIGLVALLLLGLAVLLSYAMKVWRRLQYRLAPAGRAGVLAFRATLDRLADMGIRRRYGESRERFATRLQSLAPSLAPLTDAHMRVALGGARGDADHAHVVALSHAVAAETRQSIPLHRRLLGVINPLGWWFTR